MNRKIVLPLAALSFLAVAGTSAEAQLTITANFGTPDTTDFAGSSTVGSMGDAATVEATINQALAQITGDVTTNSPENLTISFLSDPHTGLGASVDTGHIDLSYADYLGFLTTEPNHSANDVSALASIAANPYSNTTRVSLGGANLLAIGDTADGNSLIAGNGGLAGTVALNFSLLATSRAGMQSSQYDLVSVVMHEVDEILGIGGQGSTLNGPSPTDIGAMDIFRYSAPGVRSFTTDPHAISYFSIDGGVTKLAYFNQSADGDFADYGDGVSPADDQSSNPSSVQDAFTSPGVQVNLAKGELSALDVVGYNLTPLGKSIDAAPEPSTYALMALGLVGLAFGIRRQHARL